jgi:hypothetical protein
MVIDDTVIQFELESVDQAGRSRMEIMVEDDFNHFCASDGA